jgi:hypothetical protein
VLPFSLLKASQKLLNVRIKVFTPNWKRLLVVKPLL